MLQLRYKTYRKNRFLVIEIRHEEGCVIKIGSAHGTYIWKLNIENANFFLNKLENARPNSSFLTNTSSYKKRLSMHDEIYNVTYIARETCFTPHKKVEKAYLDVSMEGFSIFGDKYPVVTVFLRKRERKDIIKTLAYYFDLTI